MRVNYCFAAVLRGGLPVSHCSNKDMKIHEQGPCCWDWLLPVITQHLGLEGLPGPREPLCRVGKEQRGPGDSSDGLEGTGNCCQALNLAPLTYSGDPTSAKAGLQLAKAVPGVCAVLFHCKNYTAAHGVWPAGLPQARGRSDPPNHRAACS
jgi:hypothetical protein